MEERTMNKIKILQFSIANSNSGITQYVVNNWTYIDHEKFQFDFVTFSQKLGIQERLEATGCKVYYVRNRAEEDLNAFEYEIRDILSNHYDAVHLHTSYWKTLNMERIAKEEGIPKIIVHAHNTAVFDDHGREEKTKQHEFIKSIIDENIATDFWACSNVAGEFLYGNRIPKEKIKIMNNAIDTEKFRFNAFSREEIRNRYGWKDKFVIGHVGRFSYQKNHVFLIQVINEISQCIPNLQVVLIGKGELEEEIKEQVQALGISKLVHFVGAVDNPEYWYNAMDLFLLPSRFEGLPIVLVEAQTNGLKCVISDAITTEISLSELLYYVKLNIQSWKQIILEIYNESKEYDRDYMFNIIRNKGYDIKTQIKHLEHGYTFL